MCDAMAFCAVKMETLNHELINIHSKIMNMIDNYCEHDCPEIRDVNSIESCHKCGKHHE